MAVETDALPLPALSHADRSALLGRVADYYLVDVAAILSRKRPRHIARARQMAAALLVAAGDSMAEVGRFLDRDHSTIIHAVKQAHGAEHFRRDWEALAPSVVPGLISLDACLAAALASCAPATATVATAYLTTEIRGLPGRHPGGCDAYYALKLLRDRPETTALIAAALAAHDEWGAAQLLRARTTDRRVAEKPREGPES